MSEAPGVTMFDEPWRPKEPLFPGLEWVHRDGYSVTYFVGRAWCVDASVSYSSNFIRRHAISCDPLPWLRAECVKHLQACAKTMGLRVVTSEQLLEMVEAAREVERMNSGGGRP